MSAIQNATLGPSADVGKGHLLLLLLRIISM